jgi:resuscitation-promoting factor RpfB
MKQLTFVFLFLLLVFSLSGCGAATTTPGVVTITFVIDGKQITADVPPGISVQEALDKAKISLNTLDRVDPPSFTILTDPMTIKITRVREDFQIEESTIPFERQTVRNESLPEGQTLLIQPGSNGTLQVTYRQVFENETPEPRTVFKTVTLVEPQPEIVMVGVQTPFTAVTIPGKIAYLTAGNAWIMETSTANRRPLITSGDLDGYIFNLSSDGKWLLFSRKSTKQASEEINTLWALDTTQATPKPIDLRVKNVKWFAQWKPGSELTLAYSTVEPRSTSPGWQANNDLIILKVNENGIIINQETIIESNSGGIYGWWGTNFAWSPDGKRMAYARPDSVGLVDLENGKLLPMIELLPFQTHSDWAWVPGLGWAADHSILYTVVHQPMSGIENNEASPVFDLTGMPLGTPNQIDIIPQSGMFAYPVPSPIQNSRFMVAYLQSIFPDRSDSSRYRLVLMEQDGSNRTTLFPPEGSPGLEPQKVSWSPLPTIGSALWVAMIFQGNLYLVNSQTSQIQQITGDGSINRIDWQ